MASQEPVILKGLYEDVPQTPGDGKHHEQRDRLRTNRLVWSIKLTHKTEEKTERKRRLKR